MSKNGMTGQGVRNLNDNFGPRPKKRFVPDNCTLDIHDWSEWEPRNGGYEMYRVCLSCSEPDRYYVINKDVKKKPDKKFKNVIKGVKEFRNHNKDDFDDFEEAA